MKRKDLIKLIKRVIAIMLVAVMTASVFTSYDEAGQFFNSIKSVFADEIEGEGENEDSEDSIIIDTEAPDTVETEPSYDEAYDEYIINSDNYEEDTTDSTESETVETTVDETDIVETEPVKEDIELNQREVKAEGEDIYVSGLLPSDVRVTAERVEVEVSGVNVIAAYDIKVFDKNGNEWQPVEPLKISVASDEVNKAVEDEAQVIYVPDDLAESGMPVDIKDTNVERIDAVVKDGNVEFEAEHFSVYVIIEHMGGEVVTPRVQFHFIAPVAEEYQPTNNNGVFEYTSNPYTFNNKATDPQATNKQVSIIVRDGDKLESIEAPMNTQNTYFYGWYTVDMESDNVTFNPSTGTYSGTITYSWPLNDPGRVELDKTVSVSAVKSGSTITAINWTVGNASGTSTDIDSEGCAHVYLAPIYSNYYFVNFHLGARSETTAETLLSRKLIVLGNSNQTDVKVSDVEAPSNDPVHVVFIGWEEDTGTEQNPEWTLIRTIDSHNQAVIDPGKDGKYITVGAKTVDLYPFFVQARYINFNIGPSGNGALFLGPQLIFTSDEAQGDEYALTTLPTTTRNGYTFGGWYTGPDGTGHQVTDGSGNILNTQDYSVGNPVEYEIIGGKLKAYDALDELEFYAYWIPNQTTTYKVVIWKQKVTDAVDATTKTYDYYTYFERDFDYVSNGNSYIVSTTAADRNYATTNPNGDFTGFHLGSYDAATEVNTQGSTVLNVYYDRITYNVKFIFARRQLNNGVETGNFYVPTLNGSFSRPNTLTWLAYCTQGSGLRWDNSNTTQLATVCGYDRSNIDYGDYNGYRYYYYVITANYGAEISSVWPDYGKFPVVGSRTLTSWWLMRGAGLYGSDGQNDTVKGIVSTMDEDILGLPGSADGNFLIASYRTSTPNQWEYNIYWETLDGVDYTGKEIVTRNNKTYYKALSFIARSSSNQLNQQQVPAYTGFEKGEMVSGGTLVANFYYARKENTLTFSANYPGALAGNEPQAQEIHNIPYEQSLTAYSGTAAPVVPSEDYYFDGWYEDASGTVPFDFANEKMPAANKVVYAHWSLVEYPINVNPNGGVIDHIDYTWFTSAQLDAMGLDPSEKNGYATYFDNVATQTIESYDNLERNYVEVSDAEAAQMDPNDVYRYVYIDRSNQEGGQGKLGADARNAVYIRDTEASLSAFYDYYVYQVGLRQERDPELTALPPAQWEATYVSTEKYRKLRSGEQYVFLAWYEVVNGVRQNTPFDFSQPASHETTLMAEWRLDGGYSILYTTEYYADNNDYITANLEAWTDPLDGTSKYADGATTQAMQEPTSVMVNGKGPQDAEYVDYQFLGWQIVKVETVAGRPRYTPLEPGVYYTAGQDLTVKARYSDANMVIHMQAVYQRRDEAYRRPEIVNLTLDASQDAMGAGTGSINSSISSLPEWAWPGHYWSDSTHVYFGDTQSNTAVYLYKYATTLTNDEVTGDPLNPPGVNVFTHSEGFKLVGFDLDAPDDDFVPDYPADAIIAVAPGEQHVLYAVWEPMVYLTIKNDTAIGPVTFTLSGTSQAIRIVNQTDGSFSREALNPNQSITLAPGETIRLVVPYGEGETLSFNGTNTYGTGYWLNAKCALGYTNPEAKALTGTYFHVPNNEQFDFTAPALETHAEGIVVTFTAEPAPHTLVLDDNYTGGSTREITFNKTENGTVYYQDESTTSYTLPSTSTRIGWELLGWDEDPDATTPEYTTGAWTITDLTAFFASNGTSPADISVKTLYAIWNANADASTVYVWKNVPEPGDQTQPFTFTVSFSGKISYEESESYTSWFQTRYRWRSVTNEAIGTGNAQGTATLTHDFELKHNQYLEIVTVKNETNQVNNRPSLIMQVKKWQRNTDGSPDTQLEEVLLSWNWANVITITSGDPKGLNQYSNFSFQNLNLSVIEADDLVVRYDTSIDVAAHTTNAVLNVDATNRQLSWTDTFAGGTVIFTNTRKTADVTINKQLLPATVDPENFTFIATVIPPVGETSTYTLSPNTMTIVSGGDETNGGVWKIEGIPTGSTLTITEVLSDEDTNLNRFETTAVGTKSDNSPVTDRSDVDTIFQFLVEDDTTVTFTNTLRTQNIRLVVVDDDVPFNYLDSANFMFPGVFEGTKFSAAGTGLVWEGTVNVDEYTLTETSMPDHAGVRYTKLQAPVTVAVAGGARVNDVNRVTATTNDAADTVTVTYDNATDTYIITVVNPKMLRVTVRKTVLDDYSINSFGFTVTLTDSNDDPIQMSNVYGTQGTNAKGKLEFTLVNNQTALLYVPRNANLQISETVDENYDTVFQTGADADHLSTAAVGTSTTLTGITADKYVLCTNVRQKVNVTVEKTVIGDSATFTFNIQVKDNDAPVANFTLNNNGTPDDVSDDIVTDSSGIATFTLTPATNGTADNVFTIYKGMKVNVTEVRNTTVEYEVEYTITDGNGTSSPVRENSTGFVTVRGNTTITFTNKAASIVAPTDVKDGSMIFMIMMSSSAVCFASAVVHNERKRKGGQELTENNE